MPNNLDPQYTWFETYTGKHVNPFDIDPDTICIEDIAHHLSLICRFNGACRFHYSVGQHSLHTLAIYEMKNKITSRSVKSEKQRLTCLAMLLHDAAEAYTTDLIRPIKRNIPDLMKMDKDVTAVIVKKYGLESADWEQVELIDNITLRTEVRDLLSSKGVDWDVKDIVPVNFSITYHDPKEVEEAFLYTFSKYQNVKNDAFIPA
jgi:hypothetical protein